MTSNATIDGSIEATIDAASLAGVDAADQRDSTGPVLGTSLGGLHDEATKVDQDRLPCRVNNPELWFAESPADVEFAKLLCQDCPVRELCLVGALDRREPWGVWGGELFLQGAVIARKRPRGRPRKDQSTAPSLVPTA